MSSKTYRGTRGKHVGTCKVTVDGKPLNARTDIRNHSPTGFEWGYGGSGPAQLALAILCDHLGDALKAQEIYQRFKWKVIAALPSEEWTLSTEDINWVLAKIAEKRDDE